MDKSSTLLKYGLPFLSFMVLGSFLLREFTTIRYEVYNYRRRYIGTNRNNRINTDNDSNSDSESIDTNNSPANDEDEQLNEIIKLGQNNDWKNIRGPRPWEDNREFRELLEMKNKK